MLDMKQLRQDIDELAAHNKEISCKHKIDQVAFCPHRAIGFAHGILDKLDVPKLEGPESEYSLAARIYLLSLISLD